MTRMTPLLERNEQFARTYTPAALGLPARAGGHRHLPRPPGRPGDRPRAPARRRPRHPQRRGTRHPGCHRRRRLPGLPGRAVVRRPGAADTLFEVAIVHHTQCGTGFLADPGFRRQAAEATGLSEATLEASAVADPHATVRADVERLLASPLLLAEGERLRPRVRHRHRAGHHHGRRPLPGPGRPEMTEHDKPGPAGDIPVRGWRGCGLAPEGVGGDEPCSCHRGDGAHRHVSCAPAGGRRP